MSRVPVFQYPDTNTIPRLGQGTWYLGEKVSARKEELAMLNTAFPAPRRREMLDIM